MAKPQHFHFVCHCINTSCCHATKSYKETTQPGWALWNCHQLLLQFWVWAGFHRCTCTLFENRQDELRSWFKICITEMLENCMQTCCWYYTVLVNFNVRCSYVGTNCQHEVTAVYVYIQIIQVRRHEVVAQNKTQISLSSYCVKVIF